MDLYLDSIVLRLFLESGKYDHHLRRIRRAYAANVAMMSQAVINYFPDETRVTRPSGGFVQWVQLPESIDSLELYKDALKAGITITPGTIYSPTNQFNHFIRLNAADWSYRIERALEELGHLAKRRIS